MKLFGWRWYPKRGRRREVTGYGVEKPGRGTSDRREWLKMRNFLYYDGKEMPVVKEEMYGKDK